MKNRLIPFFLVIMLISLTACGRRIESGDELEQGIEAVENAMTGEENSINDVESFDDLREGSSDTTIGTPDDFPQSYDYGSGKMDDWTRDYMLMKMPEPTGDQTVTNLAADASQIQVLYLWEQNIPFYRQFEQQYDVILIWGFKQEELY